MSDDRFGRRSMILGVPESLPHNSARQSTQKRKKRKYHQPKI